MTVYNTCMFVKSMNLSEKSTVLGNSCTHIKPKGNCFKSLADKTTRVIEYDQANMPNTIVEWSYSKAWTCRF